MEKNRNFRWLAVLFAAVCLLCCFALLAACGKAPTTVHGTTGNGGNGDDPPTGDSAVEVTIVYNGTPITQTCTEGDEVMFADTYPDMDVSLYADFSVLLARGESVTVQKGLTIYVRAKQLPPAQVSVTYYDVAPDGTLETFERVDYSYGAEIRFDGAGFVLYRDTAGTQEIDPNESFSLTEDLSVYRKDNLDRVPVFFRVHYYVNGIEQEIGAQDTFFRGELLKDSTYFNSDTGFTFYRDKAGNQPFFEEGKTLVVRESDDKTDLYALKEDPNQHRVTFVIGDRELGTLLMYHNTIIGEYAATGLPGNSYVIRDCAEMNSPVTRDMTVHITDYEMIPMFTVTEYLCYKGDAKFVRKSYSMVNADPVWEIEASDNEYDRYYLDVNCTQVFTGDVTAAATFYRKIAVNFARYVGNR